MCEHQNSLAKTELPALWPTKPMRPREDSYKGTGGTAVFSLIERCSSVDTMDKSEKVTIYTTDTGLLLMTRSIFLSTTRYLIFMCSHMFV